MHQLQHCVFDKVRETLIDRSLQSREHRWSGEELASELPREFVEELGRLVDNGNISVRRTARLLHTTIDDLQILFDAHNVDCVIGL